MIDDFMHNVYKNSTFSIFFFLIFFIFPRTWNEACKRQVLVFNGGHGDSLPIIYHDDDDEATRTRCDFNGCSLSGITNASRFCFSRLFHVMNLRRSRLSSLFLSFIIVPFVSYRIHQETDCEFAKISCPFH